MAPSGFSSSSGRRLQWRAAALRVWTREAAALRKKGGRGPGALGALESKKGGGRVRRGAEVGGGGGGVRVGHDVRRKKAGRAELGRKWSWAAGKKKRAGRPEGRKKKEKEKK
ncbi:hypothetical protein EJB05_45339, partial [Eragrostis curvula]